MDVCIRFNSESCIERKKTKPEKKLTKATFQESQLAGGRVFGLLGPH